MNGKGSLHIIPYSSSKKSLDNEVFGSTIFQKCWWGQVAKSLVTQIAQTISQIPSHKLHIHKFDFVKKHVFDFVKKHVFHLTNPAKSTIIIEC